MTLFARVSRPFRLHHGMMYHAHFDAPRDRRLLADLLLTRLQIGHFLTGRGWPAVVARAWAARFWPTRSLRGRRPKPRARRRTASLPCGRNGEWFLPRIPATPSRIQDCPTAGRVALQVYVMSIIGR